MGVRERVENPKILKGSGPDWVRKLILPVLVVVVLGACGVVVCFITKLVQEALATKDALKQEIALLDAEADTQRYPEGMSVDEVYAVSSPESRAATQVSGFGRNVYVLSDDPKLKYLLANYHDRRYERYSDNEPSRMPPAKRNYEYYQSPVARRLLGISEEQLGRLATYLLMTANDMTAAVEIYERDDARSVVFLRRESPPALLSDRDVPYVTPLDQVNQWSLPHELAHSWDFELLDRKHNAAQISQHVSLSKDEADLIAESIADLTTALILLRETENDDTLKYQILPFRTGDVKDHIHATQYLLAKTYGGFALEDVVGKSDLELSRLAIAAIDKEVIGNPHAFKAFLSQHKQNERIEFYSRLFEWRWLSELERAATSAGRQALENAVNNLVYHDEAYPACRSLLRAIRDQIKYLGDRKLETALQRNPFDCDDPVKQAQVLRGLVSDAGLEVDWSSHQRLDANVEKIATYYRTLVALPEVTQASAP